MQQAVPPACQAACNYCCNSIVSASPNRNVKLHLAVGLLSPLVGPPHNVQARKFSRTTKSNPYRRTDVLGFFNRKDGDCLREIMTDWTALHHYTPPHTFLFDGNVRGGKRHGSAPNEYLAMARWSLIYNRHKLLPYRRPDGFSAEVRIETLNLPGRDI